MASIRTLLIGDVMGRSGQEALALHLPLLKSTLKPHAIVVNGENAARGFGMSPQNCKDLFKYGADVITSGNHIWDQKEILESLEKSDRILRPLNYPSSCPGRGFCLLPGANGLKLLIVNAIGRLFMDLADDPFSSLERLLEKYVMGTSVNGIFIDFHAEASSEKMALAHWLDGRVTAVVGTHTHVPTADAQILPKGTAYQSDLGMTGDYNSVIGMKPEVPIHRFTRKFSLDRLSPAEGEATVCGTLVESDEKTGRALSIHPIRLGGRLSPCLPSLTIP